jgi:hypothetical protein
MGIEPCALPILNGESVPSCASVIVIHTRSCGDGSGRYRDLKTFELADRTLKLFNRCHAARFGAQVNTASLYSQPGVSRVKSSCLE